MSSMNIEELTQEQRNQLVDEERRRRREQYKKEEEERQAERKGRLIRKLFLISFANNVLAFPDEHMRAVLNHAVYAWMDVDEAEPSSIYGNHWVEIVAQGDGRPMKEPVKALISSQYLVGMVEVSPARLALTLTASG